MFLLQNFCHQGTQISQKRYIQIENFYQQEWNKNFQRETVLLLGKIFFVLAGMIRSMLAILLSTEGLSKMITYTGKRNPEHTIPGLVRNYNLHMGGVDLSDMRTYIFLDERRTIRWNKKVFFTLFGRLLLNSFILYQHNGDLPKLDRQKFVVKVVKGLIGGFREQCTRSGPKIKDASNRFESRETFQTNKVGKRKEEKLCCLHKVARQHTCLHFIHLWRVQCCTMYWRMLGEISHKESFMTTYKTFFAWYYPNSVFLYCYFEYSSNIFMLKCWFL